MFRTWFKHQKCLSQKIGGLEEKKQATQRKFDVAQKILDRRHDDRRHDERRIKSLPVNHERRIHHAPDFITGIS